MRNEKANYCFCFGMFVVKRRVLPMNFNVFASSCNSLINWPQN